MANSLQDQLLKAGLIDGKKVKQAKQAKKKQKKQQRQSGTEVIDENKQAAQKSRSEKVERDRALNRQRDEEAQRKAVVAQIKQLIEINRLPKGKGDVAFNFVDNKKVKKIYVTEEFQVQLSKGRLAIVKLNEQYEIVACPIAEKIAQRDQGSVILCNETVGLEDDEDDYYAEYKIPDDLMW